MSRFDRFLFVLAGFSALVFVVGFGFASLMYPGGNLFDRTEPGYDLADNYLCDTFRARAYDGSPNVVGAEFGQIGMLGLVVAAAAILFAAPATFREEMPRLSRAGRIVASIAFFGMLLVPLTPAHEYGTLHFAAVGVASIPSLGASYLAAIGVLRVANDSEAYGRLVRALSVLTLALCTLHFGQYLSQVAGLMGANPWVPRAQKLVVATVLVWIGVVIVWARARADERISGEQLKRAETLAPESPGDRAS